MPSRGASTEHQLDPTALSSDSHDEIRMAWTSPHCGRPARNALTGVPFTWNVGSKRSREAFKVVDGTGRMDSDGFYRQPSERTSAPLIPATMFFASEADYRRWSKDRFNRYGVPCR